MTYEEFVAAVEARPEGISPLSFVARMDPRPEEAAEWLLRWSRDAAIGRVTANGWIGVDLDGTLAEYHGWKGADHIGPPIPEMVRRVKEWLADGTEVRIFTARVGEQEGVAPDTIRFVVRRIEDWCEEHVGVRLPVTNVKDFGMIELWDDRAVTVEQNTGRPLAPHQPRFSP